MQTSKVVPRKHSEKDAILRALELKELRGSIVLEKVNCGKRGCRCQSGLLHGPYRYLHFYSNGKVRRKYLSKVVAELMSCSKDELKEQLREAERVLGQETRSNETSGVV